LAPSQARRRVTAITYVEKWPQQRIEGQAALMQRIQAIWAILEDDIHPS
jgi:hypothetical protein